MQNKRLHLFSLTLAICLLLSASCSLASTSAAENLFVASTPVDDLLKTAFQIPAEKKVDFMQWSLIMNQNEKFSLNINFGESQPNTNGFKGGGEKLSFHGNFTVKDNVYELRSENLSARILLIKLNENLFHLLTPDGKLMTGNGGWSYTLNRKEFSVNNSKKIVLQNSGDEIAQKTIFEGRTPCRELAQQYKLPVSSECFKLKWKIVFLRDAKTNEPTTFSVDSTFNRDKTIRGKWKIIKGIKENPGAVIYQLELSDQGDFLSFLVGDENILFFLDKENQLLTGNSDFSFTLNRRK